jgi:arabinofuranan 3-O-arabinosyltransferase
VRDSDRREESSFDVTTVSARAVSSDEPARAADSGASGSFRVSSRVGLALFAALVYVPILLMHVGKVEADTKQYLYLDPGRLLNRAATVWDPSIGLGTLSHQTLGYVFPSGPFYWLAVEFLGLPAWIAQRLWLGTIIFLAGLGMRYMLRAIGVQGPGVPVAMLAYAFTPYVVQYAGIYSVFLGPWAALPWWIGFTARGVKRGGWLYPALFALTVQLVGALNATALFLCLLGPTLWLLHLKFVTKDVTLRQAWSFAWRTMVLTLATSLWWVVGLLVEGEFGVNLLRFTETLETVASTAFPAEFLRGLGFWFFYGRDSVGLWSDGIQEYTRPGVILVGLAIPACALLAAGMVRWRHRVFFMALVVVGIILAVGSAPYDSPSLYGAAFKEFSATSDSGMALRNSGRATPLIALGIAALLGAGITALARYLTSQNRQVWGVRIAVAVGVVCVLNAAGSWAGRYYSGYLERDEAIPQYWKDATSDLDAQSHATRVLGLPGSDYATYRWGDTRDPVEPGLMDRPYVAREIVAWGTPPSINLLRALDNPLQSNLFETAALVPIAKLMGVGDIVLRHDLATDRWGLIPASSLWRTFTDKPVAGLSEPQRYGTEIPGRLQLPELGDLSIPPSQDVQPPPVAVLRVEDPIPIARTKPVGGGMLVDGDGVGLVNIAGAGLLDPERIIQYSQSFAANPEQLDDLPEDTVLVLTDSNRKRGERWSRMFNNFGYTEQAGEKPMVRNELNQPLEVFEGTGDDARTVTEMRGMVKQVQATTYGDTILGFTPTQRPAKVIDGDVDTSWAINLGLPVTDERLRIDLARPLTTDHVNLVQLLGEDMERWVTDVTLRFDGGSPVRATLDNSSREEDGQTISFPSRTFSSLEITINKIRDIETLFRVKRNAVGFAEVRLQDENGNPIVVDETARLPQDMLTNLGSSSTAHPLAIVLSPDVMDDQSMRRIFTLPAARSFSLSGTATVSRNADDDAVDRGLGIPDASEGGVTATSKHTFGRPGARASSAIDGDLDTAWNTPLGTKPPKEWLKIEVPNRISFDHLDLALVADGRHSVPTQLEIVSDEGDKRVVDIPPAIALDGRPHQPRVSFPELAGRAFRFTVTKYTPVRRGGILMPTAIAELGIPGVARAASPAQIGDECIDDLVQVDGKAFPVRITGTREDAEQQRPLLLEPCDPNATLTLDAGDHEVDIKVSPHTKSGFDVAHLVLSSAAGGDAAPSAEVVAFDEGGTAPAMRVVEEGRASMTVEVDPADDPFWFVLGQSQNKGWTAKANGVDLGESELVDGFANGWKVTPTAGEPTTITLEWAPQSTVWKAMLASLAVGLLCVGIVAVALFRRRRNRGRADAAPSIADEPQWRHGFDAEDAKTGRAARWGATVGAGLIAAVFVRPWVGLLIAVLVYFATTNPTLRRIVRIAPAVIVGVVAIGIAGAQQFQRYPIRFEWPTFFDWARIPVWIAVMLVMAEIVMVLAQRRAERQPDGG